MLLYLLGFKEELNFAYYFGKYSAQVLTSSSMEISLLFYHFFKKNISSNWFNEKLLLSIFDKFNSLTLEIFKFC